MKKCLRKIFGELKLSWPTIIIIAIIMGIYTALVAKYVPDGNSFHDIAVTPEWWVLPAIFIIVNCKKPLDAGLKVFVFFLISQPLVYLVQILLGSDWSLFGYYRYWFIATLLTFPGAILGWYIKKDKWYSALILSVMTLLLIYTAFGYLHDYPDNFPNHLISIIYCLGIIPIFIFGIFREKVPRIIASAIAILAVITLILMNGVFDKPYTVYNNSFLRENDVTLVGKPYVSSFTASGEGKAELIDAGAQQYTVKLEGTKTGHYEFEITDDVEELPPEDDPVYSFEYHYDEASQSVVVNRQ